jgi:hypothetical protein
MQTTNADSKCRQQMQTTNADSKCRQQMQTANADNKCRQQMQTANADNKCRQQMQTTNADSKCGQQMRTDRAGLIACALPDGAGQANCALMFPWQLRPGSMFGPAVGGLSLLAGPTAGNPMPPTIVVGGRGDRGPRHLRGATAHGPCTWCSRSRWHQASEWECMVAYQASERCSTQHLPGIGSHGYLTGAQHRNGCAWLRTRHRGDVWLSIYPASEVMGI